LLFGAAAARSSFADVAGQASVVEGDPPELHQTCTVYGQEWPCGRTAAEWLREYLRGPFVAVSVWGA
jgi:hypothetical protein